MFILSGLVYIFLAVVCANGLFRIGKLAIRAINSMFDKVENKL